MTMAHVGPLHNNGLLGTTYELHKHIVRWNVLVNYVRVGFHNWATWDLYLLHVISSNKYIINLMNPLDNHQ